MANQPEVIEDDGLSFDSDLTVEPDDDSVSSSGPRFSNPSNKRISWKSPTEEDEAGNDRNCRLFTSGMRTKNNNNDIPDVENYTAVDSSQLQSSSIDNVDRLQSTGNNQCGETRRQQLLRLILQILPSFCFTCVVQFMDLMVGVHVYFIGLVIFQSLFWPSLAFLIYSKYGTQNDIFAPLVPCAGGRWINSVLLTVHSFIFSGALLLQFLSIQYLDITVSLAMSFLPIIILILMQHIISEKKCSIELVTCSLVGYLGVIFIAISSLTASHPYLQSLIYNGVAASISSGLLAIQASFILRYLRRQGMNDALVTASAGLKGTIFCVINGCIMGVLGPPNGTNSGYISSIVILTVVGISTLFILTQCQIWGSRGENCNRNENEKEVPDTGNEDAYTGNTGIEDDSPRIRQLSPFVSVLKQRVLVFVFSCIWGLFRQFYHQCFPRTFSVIGVTLIIIAFLFTMGYREWYAVKKSELLKIHLNQNEHNPEAYRRKRRFEFIPWLFRRDPLAFTTS